MKTLGKGSPDELLGLVGVIISPCKGKKILRILRKRIVKKASLDPRE
jgi:hypothetical protein